MSFVLALRSPCESRALRLDCGSSRAVGEFSQAAAGFRRDPSCEALGGRPALWASD